MASLIQAAALGLAGFAAVMAQHSPDAAGAGEAIFAGKGGCIRCHSIQNRGGSIGPDLSDIGVKRTAGSLRVSITEPDAEIYPEYLTVVVTTRQGQRMEGVRLNEDDISIQLRDSEGRPQSFLKLNLKDVRREERSLMPSYASKLSASEIDRLVAYLRGLRGSSQPLRTRRIGPLTENTDWLTRPNRDNQERPEMLLDSLHIPRGAAVADLGAGAGYFTWRLAQRVGPQGRVIAVDIQQKMLDSIAQEVNRRGIANVDLILGAERDPKLPGAALDMVFIANAYHQFSHPEAMLAAVGRCLKPDGRLVVVDYAEENADDPVAGLYRMSLRDLRSEIEAMGFELDRVLDFLPMQHGLVFTLRTGNKPQREP